MSHHTSELYKWQKQFSKPSKVYSRSQQVTTGNDIQDWIKKVEDASGRAAAATFGTKYSSPETLSKGKSVVASRVADVHIHDAAYAEAHDLLNQWVNDKLDLDSSDTEQDIRPDRSEENWTRKTQTEIRKEWDLLLRGEDGDNDYHDFEEVVTPTPSSRKQKKKKDPYDILEADDSRLVDDILQGMMDKEVVKDDFLDDLGLDEKTKHHNPHTKMQLRHQQVKENREKRERLQKQRQKEQQDKKEAHFQARQIMQKEDQKKAAKQKQEDLLIQQNMTLIRKEIDEERRLKEKHKLKEEKEKKEFEETLTLQMNQEQDEEEKQHFKAQHLAEIRKKEIMMRLNEMQQKEMKDNLKIVQRCFSVWYNMVLKRRLAMGKAKATADWKVLLKHFNAWKSYIRSKSVEREAALHEQQVKSFQRRQLLAEEHYRRTLVRKCLLAWQLFLIHQQGEHSILQDDSQRKNKMSAFLEAASSGALWSARSETSQGQSRIENSRSHESESRSSTARKVEDIFAQKGRKTVSSARSDSSLTNRDTDRQYVKKSGKPTDAWQINRKHVEVTKEDLAKVAKSPETSSPSPEHTHPRARTASYGSSFTNRHATQQKALELQQKQIKEQQRLIEEMQYLQQQQQLQQQVTQQQLVTQLLNHKQPTNHHLSEHIQKLQSEILKYPAAVKVATQAETDGSESSKDKSDGSQTNRTESSVVSEAPSAAVSTTSSSKQANFLKSMDDRAQERNKLKKERDEKRRKAEEEKFAKLQAEELERKRHEEDEKKRRVDLYKEKKRLEKQREQDRQEQMERLKQLSSLSDKHYLHSLVKYRGWLPWRQLVKMSRNATEQAEEHYKKTFVRKVLRSWHTTVEEDLREKRALADKMSQYILIRRYFNNWKQVGQYMSIQEEKAIRYYEMKIKSKIVLAWSDHATEEKMATWRKERIAREHNTKRIVLTAFRAWRRFPEVRRDEELRQKRLMGMRAKVATMIPDYEVKETQKSISFSTDFNG